MADVQVGDVGTVYRVRVRDQDAPFDPSTAIVKEIIFKLPGAVMLTKDAIVEANGSPASEWFLTYTVVTDDGAGSPPGDFHATPGQMSVQGHLRWADGTEYHSNVQTVDEDGRELRIFANLV